MKYSWTVLILLCALALPASADDLWISDPSIVAGLADVGDFSHPTVFQKDGQWELISGAYNGNFYGWSWNGTQWLSNSTMVNGLSDIGGQSTPNVFYKDNEFQMISGAYAGNFYGYSWSNATSTWVSNSSITTGLSNVQLYSNPTIFFKDANWQFITGENVGNLYGYTWNGSQWLSNSSMVSGLGDLGYGTSPNVFYKNGIWTLIVGEHYSASFLGYLWSGSSWVSNTSVVNGLGGDQYPAPYVFYKSNAWQLIAGKWDGEFLGYNQSTNNISTVPTISFPTNNSRQWNNSINYTWNASTDADDDTITYDFWLSNQSNFGYSVNRTTFTNNYTGIISINSGSTYYGKVRAYDTFQYSNWSATVQFSENAKPTVPALIQHSDFHSLTATTVNWTASTDNESDPITYDVKIYNTSTGALVVNQSNISTNYSENFLPANSTNYNYTARAYDGLGYSNWSSALTFDFYNTVPSLINITLSPSNTTTTSNLTVSMNGTDADGDPLTNHYLWYKNDVLQSWSGTYVNYTDNYTAGDIIYVYGYVNDTFENSSQLQSNIVNIGSNNSAPSFTTLTLTPSTAKFNTSFHINASGITDDSTSWQLQTYYKSGGNVYIANSTFVNTSYINITATVPFSTAGAHTVYGVIYDSGNATGQSNLTSAEAYATFTTDLTNPTVVSSSVSADAITVGTSVTISATVDGQGANISSVLVKVMRPDATSLNWTMTCGSGEIVNCTYTYTTTSDVGEYDVTYFYLTDDSNINDAISSSLSFVASNPSSGGGGGGGGGSTVVIVNPTPTPLTSSLNLSIIGITDGARSLSDIEAINKCLTESLFLSNECSNAVTTTLKNTANWYTILGIPFAALIVIFIMNIVYPKKRSYLDAGIYSLIIIIFLLAMNLMGFNIFIWNYIYNNSLSAFTFFSFMTWGFVGTVLLDEFVFTKPFGGWNRLRQQRLQL